MSKFSLPGSSFDELRKIVIAYSHSKPEANLTDVASLAGVHSTIVSRNNKFLSEISLVEGGQRKKPTDLGRRLGRAIEHKVEADESRAWAEAVQSNEPLSSVLTTVRIKGGMSEQEITKHILYVSEQSNTASNRTGARCVLDLLKNAGLLQELDGAFSVSKPVQEEQEQRPASDFVEVSSLQEIDSTPAKASKNSNAPSININIQVQLPENQEAEVYERIFAAMKKNLFPDQSNG